uniref:Actin-related protein 2/3 complex subunit 5 n=1 Tax=Tabanus bromius TaxID=304241 RepID=A0A0K8TT87_TABBR
MAKNTLSSAFRKIDVDQYNEDNFKEDEGDLGGIHGPDENEITSLLNQSKHIDALIVALSSAPLGCKNQQVKDHALNITLRVLLSIKSSQMETAVDMLEEKDLLDVLMKYIYRGFEIPSEGSSGHLLQWHEKAFSKGGVGCIVRVLSDTNRA